ncbi:unnamed protein product [Amoebophrya sp. A25]|nr:unnamed protein product [Amoebophrya sp. A25]|eukprot:GSA25T00017455001.1
MGGHVRTSAPVDTKPKKMILGTNRKNNPICVDRYLKPESTAAQATMSLPEVLHPRQKIVVRTHVERVYVP